MVKMVRERKATYNNDFSLSHFMETLKLLSNVRSTNYFFVVVVFLLLERRKKHLYFLLFTKQTVSF